MTKHAKNLEFDPAGFEDLAWWIEKDRKKALRIVKLIREVQRDSFRSAPANRNLSNMSCPAAGPGASIRNTDWSIKSKKTKSGS